MAKLDQKMLMKYVLGAGSLAGGAIHLANAADFSLGALGANPVVLVVGGVSAAALGVMHLMK